MTSETTNGAAASYLFPSWMRFPALFVIVATPAVASWLAIRVLADSFYQPAGGVSRALWIAQALGVALVVTVVFQLLLTKAKKAQVLGGFGALLELPTVGAIGATASAVPASAPFIAAVSMAAVAPAAISIPIAEPPTALAFEDSVEVDLGDAELLGGELDIPVSDGDASSRSIGGPEQDDSVTTTIVAESDETGTDESDEAGSQDPNSSTEGDTVRGSSPASEQQATTTTAAPSQSTTTTATPRGSAPSTIAVTPPAAVSAPTTTTTAAPTTTTTTTAAPPPPSGPISGTGFVVLNPSQVTSLAKGEVEVESGAQVLVEQGPVVLTRDLNVALAGSTQDEVVDAPAVTIPAGTTVCAYYIHFDVLPGGSSSRQIATMTFSGLVLGHTDGSEDQLRDTDDFELAGIDYAINKGAGAGQTDDLWVNGNTANFNFRTHGNNRDDVRLFVACS